MNVIIGEGIARMLNRGENPVAPQIENTVIQNELKLSGRELPPLALNGTPQGSPDGFPAWLASNQEEIVEAPGIDASRYMGDILLHLHGDSPWMKEAVEAVASIMVVNGLHEAAEKLVGAVRGEQGASEPPAVS